MSPWSGVGDEIERLVVRGELPLEALVFQPVDRGQLAAWLAASAGLADRTSPSRMRLQDEFVWETTHWLAAKQAGAGDPPRRPGSLIAVRDRQRRLEFAPYLELNPVLRGGQSWAWTDSSRIGLRGTYSAGTALVVSAGIFAAEVAGGRRFADPLVAGTDLILHEEQATISARFGALRLRGGRDRHHWGPGAGGALLLSEDAAPFNFAEYQLRIGDQLRWLALWGATSLHQERYLAAHRLSWTMGDNLCLSLAEGARYQAHGPHLLYLAGVLPYTLVERLDLQDSLADSTRAEQRNNVLWSIGIAWRPRPGWLCYAEVLADDIATESADMPTRGAFQVGLTAAPHWRGWDWTLGAEYTRISNYTYSVYYQDLCRCDWEHQGRPLGYATGPDAAVLILRGALDPTPAWGARVWAQHTARGAGRLGQPWQPCETGCHSGGDPNCGDVAAWSLSGDVDRTWLLGCGIEWQPRGGVRVGLWGSLERTRPESAASAAWSRRGGFTLSAGRH